MARETKVGLLAGLAFIICFAVILTNRGANGPPGLTNAFLPDPAAESPKIANPKAPSRAAKPAPAPGPNQVTESNPVTRPDPPGTTLTSSASPSVSGAQLPLLPNAMPAPGMGAQGMEQPRPQGIPVLSSEELERTLAMRSNPQNLLQPPPTMGTVPVTITGSGAGEPPRTNVTDGALPRPGEPKASPLPGISYTVKASDTLSSIAAALYGTKSRQAVQTIFDANRGVLTDMNHLKTGMVLTIPALAATAQPSAPAPVKLALSEVTPTDSHPSAERPDKKSADKKTNSKKPTVNEAAKPAASPKKFRWYQVQKNDRYASIAREQLGDASRWRELFEMNKDKFPDPQMIREGVRIKLPVTALAGGKERKN